MTTYVLVPNAGGEAWFFHRLQAELDARGHTSIAVELPAEDPSAGLRRYADTIVATTEAAVPHGAAVTVVAQSMGGLSAPLVVGRLNVREIVMLNAMTPLPSETGGEWWSATGQAAAARAQAIREGRDPDRLQDDLELYFHDADAELLAEVRARRAPDQSGRPFEDPWPLPAWPRVATRFLAAREDRLFPLEFQRSLARERLGIEVEPTPGGHLSALTQAAAIADALLGGPK